MVIASPKSESPRMLPGTPLPAADAVSEAASGNTSQNTPNVKQSIKDLIQLPSMAASVQPDDQSQPGQLRPLGATRSKGGSSLGDTSESPALLSARLGGSAVRNSSQELQLSSFKQDADGSPASPGSRRASRRGVLSKVKMQLRAMNSIVDISPADFEEEAADGSQLGQESPVHIRGHEALQSSRKKLAVIFDQLPRLLPDARWRRWWDTMSMMGTLYHGIWVPMLLVDASAFGDGAASFHVVLSGLWIANIIIKCNTAYVREDGNLEFERRLIINRYLRRYAVLDILSAPPYDSLAYWSGAMDEVVKALLALRLFRLCHVMYMFGRSNPQILTPEYVEFNFRVAPIMKSMFSFVIFLHLLVVMKLAVAEDDYPDDSNYGHAGFWVWNLLTTSPAPLTLNSWEQRVLCFLLMILGVFFQGVVIGKVSTELLKNSIQEQNIEILRTTLQVVRQYNVPRHLQQEVLSLQWHSLQSSLSAITRSDVLDSLPPVMRNEIVLYIKIDFIDRVPFFRSAAHHTKVLLADSLEQMYFEPGEFVIRAGDVGEEMYFILHGYCDVLVPNVGSVGKLTKGQPFGEVALLTQDRRSASIRALTYCDCLRLHKVDFDKVCQANPDFAGAIIEEAARRFEEQSANLPKVQVVNAETPVLECAEVPTVLLSPRRQQEAGESNALSSLVKAVAEERVREARQLQDESLSAMRQYEHNLVQGGMGRRFSAGSAFPEREETDLGATRRTQEHDAASGGVSAPAPTPEPPPGAAIQGLRPNALLALKKLMKRSAEVSPGPALPHPQPQAVPTRADRYRVTPPGPEHQGDNDAASAAPPEAVHAFQTQRPPPVIAQTPGGGSDTAAATALVSPTMRILNQQSLGPRRCEGCGATIIATEAVFCTDCGARLKRSAVPPRRCGCCDAPLRGNDTFCPHCGQRVNTGAQPPMPPALVPSARQGSSPQQRLSEGSNLPHCPSSDCPSAEQSPNQHRKRSQDADLRAGAVHRALVEQRTATTAAVPRPAAGPLHILANTLPAPVPRSVPSSPCQDTRPGIGFGGDSAFPSKSPRPASQSGLFGSRKQQPPRSPLLQEHREDTTPSAPAAIGNSQLPGQTGLGVVRPRSASQSAAQAATDAKPPPQQLAAPTGRLGRKRASTLAATSPRNPAPAGSPFGPAGGTSQPPRSPAVGTARSISPVQQPEHGGAASPVGAAVPAIADFSQLLRGMESRLGSELKQLGACMEELSGRVDNLTRVVTAVSASQLDTAAGVSELLAAHETEAKARLLQQAADQQARPLPSFQQRRNSAGLSTGPALRHQLSGTMGNWMRLPGGSAIPGLSSPRHGGGGSFRSSAQQGPGSPRRLLSGSQPPALNLTEVPHVGSSPPLSPSR
eukprot:TRINITY_DN11830_c0_g1_i1.p1 TRINITY_DN11830_c0_g1~~TRINITY_DN11830_c0_g1_i1.p1  ORF type:complete len:1369 (+),score=310.88 TRINITY_DN11830_c0_g1_i1:118-4224(+)